MLLAAEAGLCVPSRVCGSVGSSVWLAVQDKLDDKAMPAECKKEVEGHAARSSQDYRCGPAD